MPSTLLFLVSQRLLGDNVALLHVPMPSRRFLVLEDQFQLRPWVQHKDLSDIYIYRENVRSAEAYPADENEVGIIEDL